MFELGKYQDSKEDVDEDSETHRHAPPSLSVRIIPSTPGSHDIPASETRRVQSSSIEGNLHPPSVARQDFAQHRPPSPHITGWQQPSQHKGASHERTLAALSIGAPLIASVVVSCMSVVVSEIATSYGTPPHLRPTTAQVTIALMWSAVVTSLGSTMIAVAGLAMAAGYHDSHVGITKTIVRRIRALRKRKSSNAGIGGHAQQYRSTAGSSSPRPSTMTTATDERDAQHILAGLRAAEVSARLLGISVSLLATALSVHLFTVYPRGVAVSVLIAGLVTAIFACLPLLPIVFPSHSPHAA